MQKFLEEKISVDLHDLGLSTGFMHKQQEKIIKFDFTKIKSFVPQRTSKN